MTRVLLAAALLSSACWTSPEPGATTPATLPHPAGFEPLDLRVRLERTVCFGTCPVYAMVILGDGRVEWTGQDHVVAKGRRAGRVTRHQLEELSRRLERAQFFERDNVGELPKQPECTTVGKVTECSFATSVSICSDTSHTIFAVRHGGRVHEIDNDHCNESGALDDLEEYIHRITNARAWIGE